ncbi:MAG: hypothetical protein VX917_03905, partial [Chloroflexota bacterium]|nr:hypothetical protein [Chloroflexota bacterium]
KPGAPVCGGVPRNTYLVRLLLLLSNVTYLLFRDPLLAFFHPRAFHTRSLSPMPYYNHYLNEDR